MIGLLRRHPGLSPEEFRSYYEKHHRILGEKYLSGYAVKYSRRYLTAMPDILTGKIPEQDCDVILEIWYPDLDVFTRCSELLTAKVIADEIAADEEVLFDRKKNRFFYVDEYDSVLPLPELTS